MELSVVILNFNASVFLELCVESVLRATTNIQSEIIVVDNDSTDGSVERLSTRYKKIKIVKLDENYGFSKGNNIAVSRARGSFICLVNPDVIVGETVFDVGLAFAKANSKTGFLGVRLLDGTGNFLPESKRRTPKRSSALLKLLGFSSSYYDHRIKEDENGQTEILVGAFMLGKKSVYESLGGLDERYFMYGEDIDLSFTALKNGFQNYYIGSEKAIHFKGESTIKDKVYKERFFKAMSLFYDKHYPKGKFLSGFLKFILPKITRSKTASTITISAIQQKILVTADLNFKPEWAGQVVTFDTLKMSSKGGDQVIWDMATLEHGKVIDLMNLSKGFGNTYRFFTLDRSAMAGSDSSEERGEVKII
ncbi:glycosyltransferase family 2 protein [Nonlabens antarcticus]|uniref:glycosyltransferase family 2 protein n=1 Tax=Nonlabens antarcticus TaxID=392714 RepID=UPI001890C040|nr:glycosyltransferase family 2 protein [Nonlabens antarcticus]